MSDPVVLLKLIREDYSGSTGACLSRLIHLIEDVETVFNELVTAHPELKDEIHSRLSQLYPSTPFDWPLLDPTNAEEMEARAHEHEH
jgi:hypothetical protein